MSLDPAAYAAMTGTEIAAQVRSGTLSASSVVEAALARIAAVDPRVNAFTAVTAERARSRATALDAARARGEALGLLAGVPFAVKNLFDVAGLPTLAGSKINRSREPARADSPLIERLEAAGAILLGALNMGEYAYDFTGENRHDGPSRNPHDPTHMTGGSSGGSGAAVAAGLVPIALGSDTNGSIRVPASLCGHFGLKPTYGRLTRTRSFPFVGSLDHLGPMARSVADLAFAYDAMQGSDPEDPACAGRAPEPIADDIDRGLGGLRLAVGGGYFDAGSGPEASAALAHAATALGAVKRVEIAQAALARAAAYVITTVEGASLHLDRLRERPDEFDPDVRDRLFAGAMVPGAWYVKAQKFRAWYRARVLELFDEVDVILTAATPCSAPRIGQRTMTLAGQEVLVRPNLGLYTQPISFIGLPAAVAPFWGEGEHLPVGVQIIAAPWREDLVLRVARALETRRIAEARVGEGVA